MKCYGGASPSGSNTTDMTIDWRDSSTGSSNVQTAPNIAYNSLTHDNAPVSTATISIQTNGKRFNTQGMKAFYSFQVSSPTALTSAARFYFDFHMKLSPYLDNEGTVECYIRTASAISDTAAQYTYCEFTTWWQLVVWNNLNSIGAGASFYVDIYNIDLPKSSDVNSNQRIMVTIDDDEMYSNGVISSREVIDSQPVSTTPTEFIILSSSVNNNYILDTQTLTMSLDMTTTSVFTSASALYVLFPASYAQWISRGDTIPVAYPADPTMGKYCAFNQTGQTTNYAAACTFISQRVLRIDLGSVTQQLFTLTLMNINTPAAVPVGKFNQYRFKLFKTASS